MQLEATKQKQPIFNDFPPALPPAKEEDTAKPSLNKRRKINIGILLRAVCLMSSLLVIGITSFDKISQISETGLVRYIGSFLMGIGVETLGENAGTVAFGENTVLEYESTKQDTEDLSLPSVHYIPLEDITNKLLENEKLRNEKLAALYSFSTEAPEGMYAIIPADCSAESPEKLKNDTAYSIDMEEISKKAAEIPPESITHEPLVLVVHTHGTESFAEEGKMYYSDKINYPRSDDVSKNIVAVGKVFADTLNENGIPTIHCEIMHDKESYINAYDNSAASIRHYVEKYPSIQYVFDIHRDSLIRTDLIKLKPVTLYKNEPCAQIMMIIGSNEKSSASYDWESNLVLAKALQDRLFKSASGIARQLYLRGATYNQQYARHGLLIEIGSCGNTLDEAKLAAKVFGKAVVNLLKGE